MIELQSPLVTEANLFLEAYRLSFREHSVRVKQSALTQLIQFLMAQGLDDWRLCDDKVLRSYIISRAKKTIEGGKSKLSSASLETHLASIRIFYQFLYEKELVTCNYARLISPPKKERRLPKVVEADLLSQILDRLPEDELEVRDLAILELLYSSGLRLAEIAALKFSHIHFQEQMIKVVDGKGGRDRVVPMGNKATIALQKWLTVRESWLVGVSHGDLEVSLFISKKGEGLSDRQISRRVKAYAEKSGVNINLHPHLLRHSMATHVLESSQDIRLVQELLGHADIATTQVYTHLNFNHLAKVFDAAHPRAKRTRLNKKSKDEDSDS